RSKNILIEDFLERMLADPGPQLLVWLTIFHRLAAVENIRHNVRCEGCKREPLFGLRYKCTRCQHYNLCQDCFWTGVTTEPHTNAHDVKEYSSASKSHSRQFGHSLRKSFQLGRFTGSGPQAPGNVTASQTVSDRSNDAHLNKRPPLGSIFEWNSAPACFDSTNVTRNGSMQTYAGVNPHTEIASNVPIGAVQSSMSLSYRPQLPTTSIRSPLPHRRLQQLNPLFLSPATHPSFGNQPVAKASNMQHITSPVMPPGSVLPLPPNPNSQMMAGIREFDNAFAAASAAIDVCRVLKISVENLRAAHSVINFSPVTIYRGASECLSGVQSEPWSARMPERSQMAPVGPGQPMPSVMFTSSGNVGRNLDFQCREEHELIARYAAQLAAASAFNTEFEKFGDLPDSPQTQQQLIAELQAKNRKILREIERLRIEQQKQAAVIAAAGAPKSGITKDQDLLLERALSPKTISQFNSQDDVQAGGENPKLVSELNVLRQRKDDLEARMNNLQRNRTELTLQLEALVRLLSLSGGMTTTAQQNAGLRLLSPDTTTPNKSLRTMLPGTPLADIRLGHQSRTGTVRPEYPPRRSSSLCHGSTDRGGKGPQLASSSVMYIDFFYKHNSPEPSTRGAISTSTFSDRPENRSVNLGISSTSSSNHSTASARSRFPHSNMTVCALVYVVHMSPWPSGGRDMHASPLDLSPAHDEIGRDSDMWAYSHGVVSPSDCSAVHHTNPPSSNNAFGYDYSNMLHARYGLTVTVSVWYTYLSELKNYTVIHHCSVDFRQCPLEFRHSVMDEISLGADDNSGPHRIKFKGLIYTVSARSKSTNRSSSLGSMQNRTEKRTRRRRRQWDWWLSLFKMENALERVDSVNHGEVE
ncbi:dystrobrevin beta, partial [Clonorchis sinensis]